MSEEKKAENNFKFGLYLRNEIIHERIFSADLYNPLVRYFVNIKDIIPSIISNFQDVLESRKATFVDEYGYNSLNYYLSSFLNKDEADKLTKPESGNYQNPNVKYQGKGVEFKFVLFINNKPIVERYFYLENYNPRTRFSNELRDIMDLIVKAIQNYLLKADKHHMWNDNYLITKYELNIQQVRELTKEKRELYLRKINDVEFVDSIKAEYNKYTDYNAA